MELWYEQLPSNKDEFRKGVEMAIVKRNRKEFVIDQVDRQQRLVNITDAYRSEQAQTGIRLVMSSGSVE